MLKKESVLLEQENTIQKELYTINDVALMLNVHQQTLRNWERKKVVVPLRAGTRRVYTKQHLELCVKIKEFSGKGVPLKGIKEIMNNR
jgi:DNA-binding transcriptional MerR regulator